jgi:hypothetical protein
MVMEVVAIWQGYVKGNEDALHVMKRLENVLLGLEEREIVIDVLNLMGASSGFCCQVSLEERLCHLHFVF